MKISINTVRSLNEQFNATSQDTTASGADAVSERIGAQLGDIEETTNVGAIYQGIIVAKIVHCEKHPNADKLNICMIDDGGKAVDVERNEHGLVRVVCGAPNVRAGLVVAWLPPGSTVPDSVNTEPFVLGARELRGIVSNGMLASPKELALGDSHDGILEIDQDIVPGTDFAEAFGLTGDVVLDIENKMFTHRPDCFGFMGVARELAGIQGIAYKSPDWYTPNPEVHPRETDALPLHIDNQLPELVPRFTAQVMSNVQIKPSPTWMQVELAKVGSRSINNIVDYTNYFMLLTGQPLHAYDYDKVKALSNDEATITIRYPHEGETISLLNGKTVTPRPEAIMIATDKQAIGIGGVMGGADTEVDANTSNIILECANFDMYSIRRTSMANGLFTDAVSRFNKGQSPLQNLAVLTRIVEEIRSHASGQAASDVIDDIHLPEDMIKRDAVHSAISVTSNFINTRLGLELSAVQMQTVLQNVEFAVILDNDELTVAAPFWRTDIELREDIVEEVGRLYGFDKLPLALPVRLITPAIKDSIMAFKTKLRNSLVTSGANELLTYSFVPRKLLEKAGQNPDQAYSLSNALSPELQHYRMSLAPSLLDKVHPNIKAGYDKFALFEIGKGHIIGQDDDEGLPTESELLELTVAANDKQKSVGAAYYQAQVLLTELAKDLGLSLLFEPLTDASNYPVGQPYEHTRAAVVRDQTTNDMLGMIGEYTAKTRKAFKLPAYTAGFSLNIAQLFNAHKLAPNRYQPLPRFPKISQDITLKVPQSIAYQALETFLLKQINDAGISRSLWSLSPIDIYQKTDDPDHKQISMRVSVASYERTLTDKEVNKLLDTAALVAGERFGAERV